VTELALRDVTVANAALLSKHDEALNVDQSPAV
jgi:hypothetical protein